MMTQVLKNSNMAQAKIEQHSKNVPKMKEAQANQQGNLNNSIQRLNNMINTYKPIQAEFEKQKRKSSNPAKGWRKWILQG